MRATHEWDTPTTVETLRNLSAIDGDSPTARDGYTDSRRDPDITDHGNRGIERTKSHSDKIAAVRYHECDWEAWKIDSRLQHYEGIEGHDWK